MGENDHSKKIEKPPEVGGGGSGSPEGPKEVAHNLKENENNGAAQSFFGELPKEQQDKIMPPNDYGHVEAGDCGSEKAKFDDEKGVLTADKGLIEEARGHPSVSTEDAARDSVYYGAGLAAYDHLSSPDRNDWSAVCNNENYADLKKGMSDRQFFAQCYSDNYRGKLDDKSDYRKQQIQERLNNMGITGKADIS